LTCTSTTAGTKVLATLSKGSTIVASGTATIKTTKATITYKGLKKGKYGLTEVFYYPNGQSSVASHTLTAK